ncbi:MAG: DUF47 family protein [Anaerovoracaceae bacterium]|nr:DUF47 family protein [Bacillota bacterium]MDY2671274.1 DUF47 family protein [Anaerovoracaceae bacterium]
MKIKNHKKQDRLFTELLAIASNLRKGSEFFYSGISKKDLNITEFQNGISAIEQKGDDLVHKIIRDLNNAFITPIEREDALALADAMDEILDGLEDTVDHIYMFGISKISYSMIDMAEKIDLSCQQIYLAVELLSQKKMFDIKEHIIEISTLENKNDQTVKQSVKKLFDEHKDDPVRLVQIYEVYKLMERTSNTCHRVGKLLDSIVMKNA